MLDDGALRFVKPNGESVDNVAPGYMQPHGDWKLLPAGGPPSKWRGDRMDLGLAVDGLLQRSGNVPAGTSSTPRTTAAPPP
jgi:hypothetical protein